MYRRPEKVHFSKPTIDALSMAAASQTISRTA
jgi:hypothetical protein